MLTLFKRLIFCIALLTFVGISDDAQAIRFGLNSGFYNENVNVPCAGSKEFGLRLGFYFDKTANDIIYASAIRGINLCKIGGGCAQTQTAQMQPVGCAPAPVCNGCSAGVVPAQPAVHSAGASPIQQIFAYPPGGAQAAAPKTEVYLLVLPEQNRRPQVRGYQQGYQPNGYQPSSYQQGGYQQASPQYYSEPVEYSSVHAPVRGMW